MNLEGRRTQAGGAELIYTEALGWICRTCGGDDCEHTEAAYAEDETRAPSAEELR